MLIEFKRKRAADIKRKRRESGKIKVNEQVEITF